MRGLTPKHILHLTILFILYNLIVIASGAYNSHTTLTKSYSKLENNHYLIPGDIRYPVSNSAFHKNIGSGLEKNHFNPEMRASRGLDTMSPSRNNNGMGASPFSGKFYSGSAGSGSMSPSGSRNIGPGKGTSPFSAAASGTGGNSGGGMSGSGAGPFSGAMGNKGGIGQSPFSTSMTGKNSTHDKSSPFSGNRFLSSGPGGLSGGAFHINTDLLGGRDFSKGLIGTQHYGSGKTDQIDGSGNYNGNIDVDESKFDTSAYQSMIQNLFKTDNVENQLSGFGGSPFVGEGSGTSYDHNDRVHHDTAKESSVGSYADMNAYGGTGDKPNGGHATFGANRYGDRNVENSNRGSLSSSTDKDLGGSYTNPLSVNNNDGNDGDYRDGLQGGPFDVANYDKNTTPFRNNGNMKQTSGSSPFSIDTHANSGTGHGPFTLNSNTNGHGQNPFSTSHGSNIGQSPFSSNAFSNQEKGQNPFDTRHFSDNYNNQSPFIANQFSNNDKGQNPFDTSRFSTNGHNGSPFNANSMSSGSGQNPFDTNQIGSFGGGDIGGGAAGQMYHNGVSNTLGSGGQGGLDKFGNMDFSKLSGISGSSVADGSSYTGMGSSYSSQYSSNTDSQKSAYGAYTNSMDMNSYGTRTGSDPGNSAISSSQYKTPFESDNYNDLIDNPFASSSYFDTNKNNFKSPYDNKNDGQETMSYSQSGSPMGYNGDTGSYSSMGSGPGGNPFHQGGNSVPTNGHVGGK